MIWIKILRSTWFLWKGLMIVENRHQLYRIQSLLILRKKNARITMFNFYASLNKKRLKRVIEMGFFINIKPN